MAHLRLFQYGQAIRDTLYPVECRQCAVPLPGPQQLCSACYQELPWLDPNQCPRCARPGYSAQVPCGQCQQSPPQFTTLYAPLHYSEPVASWLRGLKYHDQLGLGFTLASLGRLQRREWMATCGIELLLATPLHRRRLAERGYNQAAILARQLGRQCGVAVALGGARRIRNTPPQTELPHDRRQTNVTGCFQVDPGRVGGQCVAIVDDIVTTGATVNALSYALYEAGARVVYVTAIART